MIFRALDWVLLKLGPKDLWERVHGILAVFWVLNLLVLLTSVKNSVAYVVFISIMTAISGEMSAYHGAHTERMEMEKQSKKGKKK